MERTHCDRCDKLVEALRETPLVERFEGTELEALGLEQQGNLRISLVIEGRQGARADWKRLDLCRDCRFILEDAFHLATLERLARPVNATIRDVQAQARDAEERSDG